VSEKKPARVFLRKENTVKRRFFAMTLAAVMVLAGLVALSGNAQAATLHVCGGQTVSGYILSDTYYSPTTCGSPPTVSYNVWILESYFDKPVGFQMNVCNSTRNPSGWVTLTTYFSLTRCGPAPPSVTNHNVRVIQRVS
jgi:hypothetical protein